MEETKKKVLIIDDEGDLAELLTWRLQHNGFLVDIALDGEKGLERAFALSPDCILLDIVMPKVGGWDVCRRLREDPRTKNIPILVITALPSVDLDRRAKEAGVAAVFLKPLKEKDLLAHIHRAL